MDPVGATMTEQHGSVCLIYVHFTGELEGGGTRHGAIGHASWLWYLLAL